MNQDLAETDLNGLTEEQRKELRAVLRNKSLLLLVKAWEERAEGMNKLVATDLTTEQGRIQALRKQGHIEGILSILNDIENYS